MLEGGEVLIKATKSRDTDHLRCRSESNTRHARKRRLISEGNTTQEFRIQFSICLDFKRPSNSQEVKPRKHDVKSESIQSREGKRVKIPSEEDEGAPVLRVSRPRVFMIQHIVATGKKKRDRGAEGPRVKREAPLHNLTTNVSPQTTVSRWSDTGGDETASHMHWRQSHHSTVGSPQHSAVGSRMQTASPDQQTSTSQIYAKTASATLLHFQNQAVSEEIPPEVPKASPPKFIINVTPPTDAAEQQINPPEMLQDLPVEKRPRVNLGLKKLVNSEIFEVPEEDSESTYKQGPSPSKHSSSKFKEPAQAIEEEFKSKSLSKDHSNASQIASESEDLDASGLMPKGAKKGISKFIMAVGSSGVDKHQPISFRTSQDVNQLNTSHQVFNSQVLHHDTVSLPDQTYQAFFVKGFKKKMDREMVKAGEYTPELLASPESGLQAACALSVAESSQHSLDKYTPLTTHSRQVPSRFKPKMGGGGSVDVALIHETNHQANTKALSSYHKKTVTSKERDYSETSMISYLDHKKSLNDLGNTSKSELKRSNTVISQPRPLITLAAVSDLQPRTQPEDDRLDKIDGQDSSVNAGLVASVKVSSSQKFHKSKTIGSPGKSAKQSKSGQNPSFGDYVSKAGLDRSKGFITKNKQMVTEDSIDSSKLSSQRGGGPTDPGIARPRNNSSQLHTHKQAQTDDGQESIPNPVIVREAESHYEVMTKSRVSQASSGTAKRGDGEHLLSGEFGFNSHSGPMFLSPYSVFPNKFAMATAQAFGINRRASFALNPVPVDMANFQNRSIEGRRYLDRSVGLSIYNESRDEAFMKSQMSKFMEESCMSKGNPGTTPIQGPSRQSTNHSVLNSNILNSVYQEQESRRYSISNGGDGTSDVQPRLEQSIIPEVVGPRLIHGTRSTPRAVSIPPSLTFIPKMTPSQQIQIAPPVRKTTLPDVMVKETPPKNATFTGATFTPEPAVSVVQGNPASPSSTRAVKAASPSQRATLEGGAIYEGPLLDNKPHGSGILKFAQGDLYNGCFVNGVREGKGKLYFVDGSVYDGGFVQNKMHGRGVRRFPNGEKYTGEFRDNCFEGRGEYLFWDGRVYEGDWLHGVMHGQGKINKEGRVLCEGQFDKRLLHGRGTVLQRDGGIYTGEFVKGLKHGSGIVKDREGAVVYDGQFVADKYHGKGVLRLNGGAKYEGQFENGEFQGLGILKLGPNAMIIGNFQKGMVHGKAVELLPSGNKYKGEYIQGLRDGLGIFQWAQGATYIGEFTKGKREGRGMIIYSDKSCKTGIFKDGELNDLDSSEPSSMQLPSHFIKEVPTWANIEIPDRVSQLSFQELDKITVFISDVGQEQKSLIKLIDESTPSLSMYDITPRDQNHSHKDSSKNVSNMKKTHQNRSSLHMPSFDSFCHSIENANH